MKSIIFILFFLISINLFSSEILEENKVKSIYLERFTRFIDWKPSSETDDHNTPFIIVIFGKSSFSSALDNVYSKTKIKNKKVIINYIDDLSDLPYCHIIIIGEDMEKKIPRINEIAKERNILTISNSTGFAHKGIMINFYKEDKKIKFEINEKKVRDAGFKINYLLLKAAKIVSSER